MNISSGPHPWEVPSCQPTRKTHLMAKFEILHANGSTSEVEAEGYTQKNGYFHFNGWENGDPVQVLAVTESAVITIKKID